MRADFRVVLDACVLAPPSLCDFLLTLAETPRLYLPRWSGEILEEVRRTQVNDLGFSVERAESWQRAVRGAFPEAMVEGYERFLPLCENDPKDRHVLAVAIDAGAEVIVTSNLRDFRAEDLRKWNVEAVGPDSYLISLYTLEPGVVVSKLAEIARRREMSPEELTWRYRRIVPGFSDYLAEELGWTMPE